MKIDILIDKLKEIRIKRGPKIDILIEDRERMEIYPIKNIKEPNKFDEKHIDKNVKFHKCYIIS